MIEVDTVPRLVSLVGGGKVMQPSTSFRRSVGTQCDKTVSCTSSSCSSVEFHLDELDDEIASTGCSDTMFASQRDVTRLLFDIHQDVQASQKAQGELQQRINKNMDLTRGRLSMGSIVTTRIALRRMQEERMELGRLAAMQCKLAEVYTVVQDEWQQSQSFSASNTATALVDVDISFYRQELAQIKAAVEAMPIIPRTMNELWEELEERIAKEEVTRTPL
eukprot:scaffold9946_cov188-Amphora_coffeaeformis.AAC.9